MNEIDKLEVKDLLKQALEERSLEYTSRKKFKISRKDFKDFFSNKLSRIIVPILLIITISTVYFSKNDFIIKEIIKERIVEKIVKVEFDKQTLVFTDLPMNIQNSFVSENKYLLLKNKYNNLNKLNPNESNNQQTLNKKITLLQNNLNKINSRIKNQKFNSVSCYDTKVSLKNLSNACINKVKSFLNKNKNTTVRFQIIPLLDQKDESTFTIVKSKSKQEFLKLGLSRARVLEAAWLVKDTLGKEALITYVNYIAQSKQGRGVIIRAYK